MFFLLLKTAWQHQYYYSHITDEETVVQRGLHGLQILEPRRFEPGSMSRELVDPKDNLVPRCRVLSFVQPAKTGQAPLLGRYSPY